MAEDYSSKTNIYEHGIAFEGNLHPESLRLIATATLPVYAFFTLSILDFDGHSLNERAVHLARVKGSSYYLADFYEERDLRYSMLATLYHLNRLMDLYVRLTKLFEEKYPVGTSTRGNTDDPRAFYEIDAFLGAARRVYESIRKLLWKHYRRPGERSRWSSIRKVFANPHNIPAPFLDELRKSWDKCGEKLANYRNCVAHYDPLDDGHSTCWLNWFGSRWGVTIKLPANPDTQDRDAFDFDSGPEALTYCHFVACHLVGLCESLEKQPQIATYLANQRRD